jgi:hypothetical protein
VEREVSVLMALNRPAVCARESASRKETLSGSFQMATKKQEKMPIQMMVICTTSVQITDRFPPLRT